MKDFFEALKHLFRKKAPAENSISEDSATENSVSEKAPEMQKPTEPVSDLPRFKALAEECRMGDIVSMMEMAMLFRNRFSDDFRRQFDAFLESAKSVYDEAFRNLLIKHPKDDFFAKAYMFWVCRAAMYGNAEAMHLVNQYPVIEEGSYLPAFLFSVNNPKRYSFWDSERLYDLGLTDVDPDHTDCELRPWESGFLLEYVSYYEPPDEDGFGAEYEYDTEYYDEFFKRIKATDRESFRKGISERAIEREEYWKNHVRATERKYRERAEV